MRFIDELSFRNCRWNSLASGVCSDHGVVGIQATTASRWLLPSRRFPTLCPYRWASPFPLLLLLVLVLAAASMAQGLRAAEPYAAVT